jgi:hypothetical protein
MVTDLVFCWPDLVGSGGFCGGFMVVARSCSGGVGVYCSYCILLWSWFITHLKKFNTMP